MAKYYFLASLLPRLEIGHMPTLGFPELKELLRINLTEEDQEKVTKLLRLIDFENMRALWSGEPIDPRGNYTKEGLEQALHDQEWKEGEEFPDYLRDFLEKYKTNQERLKQFPLLMSQFLDVEREQETGFLKEFFTFEREWRLVMVGFRAKKLGKNIDVELQYEDPTDTLVAQLLAQKDAKVYEPPFEYKELKPVFEAYGDSPLELHQALYEYRFQQIFDFQDMAHFSIDRILGYIARLLIVEKWLELDVQKGIEIIDTIERNVQ